MRSPDTRCRREDCFANDNGYCTVLTESFDECNFYKCDANVTKGRYYATINKTYTPSKTIDGKKLKYWRKINGITQEKLAEMLDVCKTTIVFWERGTRVVPGEYIARLNSLGADL